MDCCIGIKERVGILVIFVRVVVIGGVVVVGVIGFLL